MAFTSKVLSLEVKAHVATLWLDRPEARNALGGAFWRDLPIAAAEIATNDDVRCVVVAARGPHFTVGLDLKEFGAGFANGASNGSRASSNARSMASVQALQASVTSLADLAVPVIAAVHGYCLGGGIDLICATDIRLASSDTIFSVRETKIAIVADLGTLQRFPRLVSAGHVAELTFTGRDFDAEHAAAIGFVNRVVEGSHDEVVAAAHDLAEEIAANSPLAVRGTKAVLAANDGHTVSEGLDFVARWNTLYLQSNDLREAMTAFVEKRAPVFRGD